MAGTRGGGPAPRPPLHEFAVPTDWRCLDFVSDLHLSAELPATRGALLRFLDETPADAVFILGDLFELWVGDDAVARPFERDLVDALAEAGSRRPLAFMCGNRDFLVGRATLRATGMMGLPDPTVLVAWGQRVLLTHGDALCLADHDYQAFRREVRDPAWQQRFLARPLSERLSVAAGIRRASAERRRFDGDGAADVDPVTAVAWMHAMGAAEMVHGHTHRPGSETLAPGYKRHVLSDWDLDDAERPRAEVLRLSRDGFVRLPVAGAAAPSSLA